MMKKFYKQASYSKENGYCYIVLDGKYTNTPRKKKYYAPSEALAHHISDEWQNQQTHIKPHTMPLTQIAATIIDQIADNTEMMDNTLYDFAHNDMLFYTCPQQDTKFGQEAEQKRQEYMAWAKVFFKAMPLSHPSNAITAPIQQSKEWGVQTKQYYKELGLWPYGLLCQMVTLTHSFIVSTMLLENAISVDDAHNMSESEYYMTLQKWGHDEILHQQLMDKKQQLQELQLCYSYLSSSI